MNELFRIADLQDCIEIEKENYVKAKKKAEHSLNEMLKCYEEIIRLQFKADVGKAEVEQEFGIKVVEE